MTNDQNLWMSKRPDVHTISPLAIVFAQRNTQRMTFPIADPSSP
jgi:hypothetical protein